jgi:hypothetical protein
VTTEQVRLATTSTRAVEGAKMYRVYLDEILRWRAETGRRPQPPASDQEILELRERSVAELGSNIPDGYADFLKITNGLFSNGVCTYASRTITVDLENYQYNISGFIEATLMWRSMTEDYEHLLVFADSDLDMYVWDPVEREYRVQDRGASDMVEAVYRSFDELMTHALWTSLPPDLKAKFPNRLKGQHL